MARLRALLIGFEPGFAGDLAGQGIDVVCRIGGGVADQGLAFIDHHEFFDYAHFDRADPPVPFELRQSAHEAGFAAFALCANRYVKSKALLTDFQDHELLFDKALSQARSVLERFDPQVVISANVPHRAATLALFQYARASGLRIAVCLQSQFPGRLFIVDHWDDLGIFASAQRGEAVDLPHDPPEKMPFYMSSVDTPAAKQRRAFIKYLGAAAQLIAAPFLGLGIKGQRGANRALDSMRNAAQLLHYNAGRKTMPAKASGEISGDYVYFPMHLQPEMTTDILGGRWSNQVLALQKLRGIVPDTIPIIIKENPKQTGLMRSALFWEIAGTLKNVFFVEDAASSLELVRRARLTATITGTAGWEALRCGKPALAFGSVFWRNLPGAFHVDDAPSWKQIEAFAFDQDRFSQAVSELSRHTYAGVADPLYAKIVKGFDAVQNQETLAASIAVHVNRK